MSEIRKPAEFLIPKAPKKSKPRKAFRRQPEHLKLIRALFCLACNGSHNIEAHHMKQTGDRGMGMKSSDRYAVPLCHSCHADLETRGSKNELTWFEAGVPDPLGVALDLFLSTGDLAEMIAIMRRAKI